MPDGDAVVIGSGPNGLAAAISLAQKGLSVTLYETRQTVGGGMRSGELTLPGFIHDICSTIHPLAINSPFFKSLPLEQYGLKWIQPTTPLAHPFEDGSVALLQRSIQETGESIPNDAKAYTDLMTPFVEHWEALSKDVLAPLHFPTHPLAMLQFGFKGMQSAKGLANRTFRTEQARALFAGLAAHSTLPLNKPITAAYGLILGTLGHAVGWPIAHGGSQNIANALAAYFESLGGKIVTGHGVKHLEDLPKSEYVFLDLTPKQILKVAGSVLPTDYKSKLAHFRYGPGVFKIDWALNSPIPWKAKECLKAGTVHIGSYEDILHSEKTVWKGEHSEKPFVILAQQTLFDPIRAPEDKHTAWAYCHVPNGSSQDMSEAIESQIERLAPGFKDCILAKATKSAVEMQQYNSNYIGGDISGGVGDFSQLFKRPVSYFKPYTTPVKGLYICSASTPPGGGVHGLCGYYAVKEALNDKEE